MSIEVKKCSICGKSPKVGYNKPNSLHKTKKVIMPNLQKYHGNLICTKCLRSEEVICSR